MKTQRFKRIVTVAELIVMLGNIENQNLQVWCEGYDWNEAVCGVEICTERSVLLVRLSRPDGIIF